jgi:small subunit ribosomal protein S13
MAWLSPWVLARVHAPGLVILELTIYHGTTTRFQIPVRILNTDLDGNRPIGITLRKIKGINFMFANAIVTTAGIDPKKKTGVLSDAEIKAIETILAKPLDAGIPIWMINRRNDPWTGQNQHLFTTDMDLAKDTDIKIMKKIKCYKGVRHMLGQPVRGQRTKSNFRRNKGKVQGVIKKKIVAAQGGGKE